MSMETQSAIVCQTSVTLQHEYTRTIKLSMMSSSHRVPWGFRVANRREAIPPCSVIRPSILGDVTARCQLWRTG